ncbi:HSPB1-associated protein 1 homolog [Cololabis saira]|uniref:HSPB1-associated protein 1 homolog n=1 Tax=Cololabis saira TaxID=129043 RepID=UPI002AD289F3|nr:HSPB1-associated protein 1 homolog [Cololabis saira]
MAATAPTRPFGPDEARRIVRGLQQPAVFPDMTGGWAALRWTAEHLSGRLADRPVQFRLGRKEETNAPLFETQCSYVQAKVAHFLNWTGGQTDVGPFSEYSYADYWAYADYKYIATLFKDQPFMFEDVKWSEFGFEGRDGRDSTLWLGTAGANTPCHQDSYGCNLVLQVQGRKRWHLFPPEDTAKLYPTRIPYEESSVFSSVDVLHPDLTRFPAFQLARKHVVTLHPGQVLYVPRHWWHYVESIDPVTVSVNSWIELEVDGMARVAEAVTKTVVWAIKRAESDDGTDSWLNPTEDENVTHEENMRYVNLAVRACPQRRNSNVGDSRPAKRDWCGHQRGSRGDPAPFTAPFGTHLLPVSCEGEQQIRRNPNHVEVRTGLSSDVASQGETPGTKPSSTSRLCGPSDGPDGSPELSPEDSEESTVNITTNDLLGCLLHPDIISRVSELLLERHHQL